MANRRAIAAVLCAIIGASAGSAEQRKLREVYEVVHGWPRMPEGRILGQATGVDVDSRDQVHVFHRSTRTWSDDPALPLIAGTTVEVFDANGRHLRTWGANKFVMPHGLTIDRKDNVWLTDVGLHQVFKFSPDGKLLLVLGEARVAGADQTHFNKPTDVAVLPDGSFYVADGYGNTRVIKFSANGEFQYEWGRRGAGAGEFDLPHAIDTDAIGRVYVADRSNSRVQVFDDRGKFLSEWRSAELGRPFSIAISGNRAAVVDGGDQSTCSVALSVATESQCGGRDRSSASEVDLTGRVLARFGRFGNYDGQFRVAHDVAFTRDGSILVVDVGGQRLQRFVRRAP
jgi:peptidylamidoglycolate lyase